MFIFVLVILILLYNHFLDFIKLDGLELETKDEDSWWLGLGVCKGLSDYFEWEVLYIRIFVIILVLIFGIRDIILSYMLLVFYIEFILDYENKEV